MVKIELLTGLVKKLLTNKVIEIESVEGNLILNELCPVLYELMNDGLLPYLDTIFGKIVNNVWRLLEASIQYGKYG